MAWGISRQTWGESRAGSFLASVAPIIAHKNPASKADGGTPLENVTSPPKGGSAQEACGRLGKTFGEKASRSPPAGTPAPVSPALRMRPAFASTITFPSPKQKGMASRPPRRRRPALPERRAFSGLVSFGQEPLRLRQGLGYRLLAFGFWLLALGAMLTYASSMI